MRLALTVLLYTATAGIALAAASPAGNGGTPDDVVSFAEPRPRQRFAPREEVTLRARVTIAEERIKEVVYYANGKKLGKGKKKTYTRTWKPHDEGRYTLMVEVIGHKEKKERKDRDDEHDDDEDDDDEDDDEDDEDDEGDEDGGNVLGRATVEVVVGAPVPDNQPPTVTFTNPSEGSAFTAGDAVTLRAEAADADGTVVKVVFLRNGNRLGEDATAPYAFVWQDLPAGEHQLQARALDEEGASTTTAPLRIRVTSPPNEPPTVALTAPAEGTMVDAGATLTLRAEATDADGTVARVVFFQGSTRLGEDATAPYVFAWQNVPAGTYQLHARAVDDDGARTQSDAVTLTVSAPPPNEPPTVALTAPTEGTTVDAGATLTLRAEATDADGTVVKVAFFQGNTKLGEATAPPYRYAWTNAPPGTYILTAKATDDDGAVTTSAAVHVTVRAAAPVPVNRAPTVALTAPGAGTTVEAGSSLSLQATASDPDGTIARVAFFRGNTKLGEDATAPYRFTWEAVPAGTHALTARAVDDAGATTTSAAVTVTATAPTGGPRVVVWHGLSQRVGHLGAAQDDFNLLGHVADPDGVASLTYRLNGGRAVPLTVLDESYRRLAAPGDFNADIPISGLRAGSNTILLTATDELGNMTTVTVTVTKQSGAQPLPITVDWSRIANPQQVGQYVDGRWTKTAGGLRIVRPGYDRLFLLGNRTWQDYEAEVEVTVHAVNATTEPHSGWPGLGLLYRFAGHTVGGFRNWPDEQPKWGHQPYGAITWFRWTQGAASDPVQQFFQGDYPVQTNYGASELKAGQAYVMKGRCETLPDAPDGAGRTRYRWKVWRKGDQEPITWGIDVVQESVYALRRGGLALIAHEVEATFGTVKVTPLETDPAAATTSPALTVVRGTLPILSAQATGAAVTLRWQGSATTRYAVDHAAEGSVLFERAGEIAGQAGPLAYEVEGLAPGPYQFRVVELFGPGLERYGEAVTVDVGSTATNTDTDAPALTEAYELTEAYPNPFNPEAWLRLRVRERQRVQVAVYDVAGHQVGLLYAGEVGAEDWLELRVAGSRWASGLYIIRAVGERFTAARKVLLLK